MFGLTLNLERQGACCEVSAYLAHDLASDDEVLVHGMTMRKVIIIEEEQGPEDSSIVVK